MSHWIRKLQKWWAERNSCSTVFTRYAAKNPGIEFLRFDHQKNVLEMAYTAELAKEKARVIAQRIAEELAMREPLCSIRRGNGICEDCSTLKERAHPRRQTPHQHYESTYDGIALTVSKRRASKAQAIERVVRRVRLERDAGFLLLSRNFWEPVLSAVTLLILLASAIATRVPNFPHFWLYAAGYIAGGYYGVRDAFATLREKRLDVNFLMVAAALGAAIVGQPREGLILLFLFSLSNTLQGFALSRTRHAIRGLMELAPETATLVKDGSTAEVLTELLQVGDVVLVKPGQRVPVDGVVVRGGSEVDQAPITGESVPVWKERGDVVYAGTINGAGALEVEVTARQEETLLNRIMLLVEKAQSHKAKTQVFLEKFEQRYAAAVIAASALIALILPIVSGWTWSDAFYRAMTFLVVASPCALVISTPATLLSAVANAARSGILFKGGEPLERLAEVKAVALDKTGTLTEGKLRVTRIFPRHISENDLLQILLDVESLSEHLLAGAVVREATARGLKPQPVEQFEAVPGKGITAIRNGKRVCIGTPEFVSHEIEEPPDEELVTTIQEWQSDGESVIAVAEGNEWKGIVGVADQVRPGAAEAIERLKKLGMEPVIMLTGDSRRVAESLGKRLGVDVTYAELLPEEKLKVLEEMAKKYGAVAMVGDGVNDAPALAAATIGIAMGAGTDVALETADVALIGNDLYRLSYAIALAKQAMTVLKQNLVFSGAVIIALVLATFWGDLRLPLGVIGHEGSTLVVVLNGLRLLVFRND